MPASLASGLGYDEFRAYKVRTGSGNAKAAVVVGTTPAGRLLGRPSDRLDRRADPRQPRRHTRTIAGRTYSLYYDSAQLHMIAWRVDGVAYWVSNTLDDELTNRQMLTLATSCVRVPRGG